MTFRCLLNRTEHTGRKVSFAGVRQDHYNVFPVIIVPFGHSHGRVQSSAGRDPGKDPFSHTKVTSHGFDTLRFRMADDSEIDLIFKKRLSGESCTEEEIHKFRTAFLLFVGAEYVKRDWVSQLHFAVKRENNDKIFAKAGANAGIDCINNTFSAADLADFLNASSKANALPKTIVYSLNPNDNALIDTVIACFQDSSAKGKLQHGSAWWFNDNLIGMESHLETLASLSSLNGFVGMLTDSRSFVSYTRHDYFRRILCAYLGRIAENGEFPKDYSLLGKIAENVSYKNALNYFNFKM